MELHRSAETTSGTYLILGPTPSGSAGVWQLISKAAGAGGGNGVLNVDGLWKQIQTAAAALPAPDGAKYVMAAAALLQAQGMTVVPNAVPQQQGALPLPNNGGVQTYSYLPGGTPPTFQFTIPQVTDPPAGVAADELNAFSVVFLDANYNEIDYSVVYSYGDYSAEDVDGFTGSPAVANSSGVFVGGSYIAPMDESVGTVSWQPTEAEWQVIAAANPAYWEVVGRDGGVFPDRRWSIHRAGRIRRYGRLHERRAAHHGAPGAAGSGHLSQ